MEPSDSPSGETNAFGHTSPVCSRQSSFHIPRETSWGTPIPPPSQIMGSDSSPQLLEGFETIDLKSPRRTSESGDHEEEWNTLDNIAALGLSFNTEEPQVSDTLQRKRFPLDGRDISNNSFLLHEEREERPFNKWMRNLQRRATQRRQTVSGDMGNSILDRDLDSPSHPRRSSHKKSSSGSSFGFVTAVKSASISLASISVAPRSRRTGVSSRHQRTDRSSKASNVGRLSEDSSYIDRSIVVDQAVTNRLLQRRRILEEIISTEESYVADVKFLMNAYVTLLASIPSLSLNLRSSINRNLNEIVELHEELLGDLHRVVPHSEYTQTTADTNLPQQSHGHHRWRSLDAVPENTGCSRSWLQKIPGMTAEPKIAAEVAKVFAKKLNRFFIYEEYGAKYEMMIKDVASAYRTIPLWEMYQKGLEALASSLASLNSQHDNSKKALTIGDLLVKPIQRVCKYPLLFSELLKQTPVCDCPDSHMEIENVLIRLREATTEINRATNDPRMKATIEKSWLLQDRLVFADKSNGRSKNSRRTFGHVHLCGVLHASWQTRDGVDGQYMISILYRDFLLLATTSRVDSTYAVQACIGMNELKIEEVDNGRGLQCHTAPYSWKLVFECDHRLFEVTMSACSPTEELEWRSRLADRLRREAFDAAEQALFTSLSLAIKPLGTVFGKPGTIARRISIHRATTVGAMSGLCQVIIKNTNAFKESTSTTPINRSQSLLTTNRIPVLAPPRSERARLEALISDVWSRDVLPFPGMTGRARSEHLVRASASSMMRKLSVASITSNFTKRSGSLASLHKATDDDDSTKGDGLKYEQLSPTRSIVSELDDPMRSRLSIIQDEKENMLHADTSENTSSRYLTSSTGSQASTLRRLATMKDKPSWAHDGQRIITPPLRTSSVNSVNQSRVTLLSTMTDGAAEEKESASTVQSGRTPQSVQKVGRRSNVIGKSREAVVEGIKSLFR